MVKVVVLCLVFFQSFYTVWADDNLKFKEEVRKNCRNGIIEKSFFNDDKSLILKDDRAEDLVEESAKMIYRLDEMEKLQLLKKNVSHVPWSDSYWPLYQGGLGNRYNDPDVDFENWKAAHKYILAHPAKKLIQKKQLDYLSPSEKYDLLLGLDTDNLTKSSWADGEAFFKKYKKVETWMGLCHGWAAASMMMDNPENTVILNTTAGKVNFYPSDVKSLGTLLWAKGQFNARFIGGRCNSKVPTRDSAGRLKEADCLDNNPGTWHLAVVNQIGLFDRSFVMDASYDYQVWNQPVYGYEYSYYNVNTKKETSVLTDALVDVGELGSNERKDFRAPETKSVVGVKMKVTYVTENDPSIAEFQATQFSNVEYVYDLELDTQNKIIGGEWYSDDHPDFLWVADKNTFPETYGDNQNIPVDLNNISPLVQKAAEINARNELPYGAIVRELFKASAH